MALMRLASRLRGRAGTARPQPAARLTLGLWWLDRDAGQQLASVCELTSGIDEILRDGRRDDLGNLDPEDRCRATRLLMLCALRHQLMQAGEAAQAGRADARHVLARTKDDYVLGYLFGLAANHVDANNLPRSSEHARAALPELYSLFYGRLDSFWTLCAVAEAAAARESVEFGDAMAAAHEDMNSWKRRMVTPEQRPTERLLDYLLGSRARAH